ncbi:hypothetical protein Tco_0651931 [Tanacetum coccineum]|uniref:Uncharacterized protein n=1 Tax=Tanacetum coccineum TaxID=301880 RepID=A0ABQ4WW58_9ASTR
MLDIFQNILYSFHISNTAIGLSRYVPYLSFNYFSVPLVSAGTDALGKIAELDEGQAGLDLGKTPESQPPPEHDLMEEDQAGSDPGLSHHATEEQVHMEIPLSSSGTLSSMKNLDNFNFGDQFVNDNPTEEDSGKTNMETEVESMVTVSIRQASILVPHLSTPIVDLSPLKLVSSPLHEPFIATTTEATTTTLLLPPLP